MRQPVLDMFTCFFSEWVTRRARLCLLGEKHHEETEHQPTCDDSLCSFILHHLILFILSTLPLGAISLLLFHLCLLLLSCASTSLSLSSTLPCSSCARLHLLIVHSVFPPSPIHLLPPPHPSSSGCPCTRLPALPRSLTVPESETQLPPLFLHARCVFHTRLPPALIHHSCPLCVSRWLSPPTVFTVLESVRFITRCYSVGNSFLIIFLQTSRMKPISISHCTEQKLWSWCWHVCLHLVLEPQQQPVLLSFQFRAHVWEREATITSPSSVSRF